MSDIATRDDRPPIMVLRDRLESRMPELKAALTDVPPERFIRAVMTSAQLNPEILACSWPSIWESCMRACRDELLPDGVDGAIVPFKGKATWIPMYQGLLRRFRRSGQFKWVQAGVVRQGEEFSHWIDESGEHFKHVPGANTKAQIVKIYALARTLQDGFFCAVIPIDEANKIKNMSRATREDAPWKVWPEEMYKKTALRRLSKYLPSARDLMDDDMGVEPPDAIAADPANLQRASGAAATLQTFAGISDVSSSGSPRALEHGSSAVAESPQSGDPPADPKGAEHAT
jgi:recombination protein RecT